MTKPKKLLLLVNLGSPKSPQPDDVGTFLNEFLMDPLVINIPKPIRWLLVKKLIVPRRKFTSAEAYQSIWMGDNGSPLVYYTEKFKNSLSSELKDFHVDFAMRYNGPSIQKVLDHYKDFQEVYLLPVYPQYAESSSETVLVEARNYVREQNLKTKIYKLDYFYNSEDYIDCMVQHIETHLQDRGIEHILFSYHGLPESHLRKLGPEYKKSCLQKDCCPKKFGKKHLCYRSQCFETTQLIKDKLNFKDVTYSTSFQSRLGRAEWVKPYTTEHVPSLVNKHNVKKLAVVSPSFVADCLETLEEIDMELREQFEELGGNDFYYVPALNDSEAWVKRFAQWVSKSHNQWDLL